MGLIRAKRLAPSPRFSRPTVRLCAAGQVCLGLALTWLHLVKAARALGIVPLPNPTQAAPLIGLASVAALFFLTRWLFRALLYLQHRFC